MKAIHFTAKGRASLAELPLDPLLPGHARIRVKASGLCHTDIDVLHARYGDGAFPVVPGHEYAGEVVEVADDVVNVRPGSRVVVDPNLPCGHCRSCRKGLTNLCLDLKAYGVTHNGGFAEFSTVKANHLHDIGEMSYDLAALSEPLACVLNGIGSANPEPSRGVPSHALVFGAGPIGLLLGLSLQARGFETVTVSDVNEERLAFASGLGLRTERAGSDSLAARRRDFDVVADATGVAVVVEGMIDFVADGGTAMIFGVCAPDVHVAISPFTLFRRQIKLAGSHSLNRNIPQAIELIAKDQERMSKLVTHRLPLEEMAPYFLAKPTDPATMKVQYVDG